jgi:hypothetical protein
MPDNRSQRRRAAEAHRSGAVQTLAIPAVIYLALFVALNPHLPGHFSTDFYFRGVDGFQNVWNLWWVNKAVLELHTLPWWTNYLHHPVGTTLAGHTLNPFNGLLAIVLLPFLSLVQTYNAIVVFSFVTGGVTAFLLCRKMTESYSGSLLGGAIFTFSSFHFMHMDGHLQLTALEWIPLFLLCWMRVCDQRTWGRAAAAAATLWLVGLCDLYYFSYCVIAGGLFVAWRAWSDREWLFLIRPSPWPVALGFVAPTLATTGVVLGALVYQHATDPFFGTHSPRDLSMDLLSPFVWGYYWRFRDTVTWWSSLSKYVTEASVHVGWSVVALAIYGWRQRSRAAIRYGAFWLVVVAFFGVMALGPNLKIGGHELKIAEISFMGHDDVNPIVLPYAVLWLVFPPWRLAGVPLRMMVMVQLATAVLAAAGWQALSTSPHRLRRVIGFAMLAAIAIEYLPYPQPVTPAAVPSYVAALKTLPAGAVIDLASNGPQALYYQTVHEKPIAFGYISRTPTSVDQADMGLARLILDGAWDEAARANGFHYVVKRDRAASVMIRGLDLTVLPPIDASREVFRDGDVAIYQFQVE